MQSSKCLFSASAALHRVFIHPIEAALPRYLSQNLQRNVSPLRTRSQLSKSFVVQSRSYIASSNAAPTERRLPRDTEIRNKLVNVIDEDGVFHEPMPTREVLATLDPRTHSLVCVTAPPDDWSQPAIARVLTRMQLAELGAREKERAKEAKKKHPGKIVKILELNWAIDNNDLAHRIGKMKEFLGKGFRVEITISPKRKGKKATVEEKEELLAKLREAVSGEEGKAKGWSEWKQMDGLVDPPPPEEGEPVIARHKIGVITLHFQGKVDPEAAAKEMAEEEMVRQIEPERGEEKLKGKEEKDQKKEKVLTAAQLKKRDKWKKKERGELDEFDGFERGW